MEADGDETEVPLDVGVERLIRLLWMFRRQGQTRTNEEIEDCGYPDVRAEGSVGRKNFYNDRERLKDLGVTLEQTKNQNGWRVSGGLDDVTLILTSEERDALTEARLLVAEEESVADVSQPSGKNRAFSPSVPAAVPMILAAISDQRPVRFAYGGRTRFADPYRVAVTPTDRWYLLAIDRNATNSPATRTFRIDRITDLTSDRDATVPPCPPDATWPLHPVAWGGTDTITATVRFPHEPPPEWLAMLGQPDPAPTVPSPSGEGTVELSFSVTNRDAFVRRTLAVGATITGPDELVDRARAVHDAHMRAYGSL